MVRMVMEVRPDPRIYDESSSLTDCKPLRGRSGTLRSGRPARSRKPSRATRSPSQQFASRIYWRDVTQAELRQHQRSTGLREAVSLLATAHGRSIQPQSLQHDHSAGSADIVASQPAPTSTCSLDAFVTRALESHAQAKLDQRIANEWEVVNDVDAEEYVLI